MDLESLQRLPAAGPISLSHSLTLSLPPPLTCVVIKVDPASHGVEHGLWLFEDLLLHERPEVSWTGDGSARQQEGTQSLISTQTMKTPHANVDNIQLVNMQFTTICHLSLCLLCRSCVFFAADKQTTILQTLAALVKY